MRSLFHTLPARAHGQKFGVKGSSSRSVQLNRVSSTVPGPPRLDTDKPQNAQGTFLCIPTASYIQHVGESTVLKSGDRLKRTKTYLLVLLAPPSTVSVGDPFQQFASSALLLRPRLATVNMGDPPRPHRRVHPLASRCQVSRPGQRAR